MTKYIFPSCKISAAYPAASRQLAAYLKKYPDIRLGGCCRPGHKQLQPGDTALVLCHTCANIIADNTQAAIEYIWQLIDQDAGFPFPDYQGEEITLVDCLLTEERPQTRQAARSLLGKMNFRVVEPPQAAEPFRCTMLLSPCSEANLRLAPQHYGAQSGLFRPLPPSEQEEYFKSFCQQITTRRAAGYCGSCVRSLAQGGKQAAHLLELLFPEK